MSPTLAETQQLFWKLIAAPEGAASGLQALASDELASARSLVRDDDRLSAVERFDIYANMYFFRILDVLKEDFPALLAVIGDDHFHNLITDYLIAHPSSHFSLRFVGMHLPSFLAGYPLQESWPFLADLASFEWALLDAFDARDDEPIPASALAQLAPENWPGLRFVLTSSLRSLELQWPVLDIWSAARAGEPISLPESTTTRVRVWRQNMAVWHRRIEADEADALAAVGKGATFAEICEQLAADGGEENAPVRAATLLQTWLADGLVTAPDQSE